LVFGLLINLKGSLEEGPIRKKRISTASVPHMVDSNDGEKATEVSKQYSCHMTGLLVG